MQTTNQAHPNGPLLAIGSVVEALPNTYHAVIGIIGDRFKIARITYHTGSPCYWGNPATKHRIPGRRNVPAVEIGSFIENQQCVLGDGSDFRLIASAH